MHSTKTNSASPSSPYRGIAPTSASPWQAGPASPPVQSNQSASAQRRMVATPTPPRNALTPSGVAVSPMLSSTSLDTYGVVQILERELATERAERRDEVSFIAKTYEKEIEVWKSRAQCASQRLEEERRIFERESASLDSQLAVALEKTRWYEERVQKLEEEVARRDKSLEDANELLRRAEAASAEAAKDREIERHRDRELTQQEHDRLHLQIQRIESTAQEASRSKAQEELAAQAAVKNMEGAALALREQESKALAHAQHLSVEEVEVMRSQIVLYEGLQKEALRTDAELRQESETSAFQAELERAELKASLVHLSEREKMASDNAKIEHQVEISKLERQVSELTEERVIAHSAADHLRVVHERAEQAWEHQVCEATKRFEGLQDDRKEFNIQREQAYRQESEAATLRRLEVTWLRSELEDLKSRSARDLDEVRQYRIHESEQREAREQLASEDIRKHVAHARDLEVKLGDSEIEHVRLRAALAAAEKDESRSSAALDRLRPELAACEAKSSQAELRCAEREREAQVSHETRLAELQKELMTKTQDLEKQKMQFEASHSHTTIELKECEAARAQADEAQTQLKTEMQQILCSYHMQQQHASQLDSTMRQHLEMLDQELSDLCGLREVLAAADYPGETWGHDESLNALLNAITLPASPTQNFS